MPVGASGVRFSTRHGVRHCRGANGRAATGWLRRIVPSYGTAFFAPQAKLLERYSDASFVTISLDEGVGCYGDVSENDPVIVSLRARRGVLDLHAIESDLAGEFVYLMMARRRLVGALVVGPKRSGDTYAPDESAAIAQLAQAAGDAINVLLSKTDALRDTILEELRDAMNPLPAQLSEGLPDAIIERLRARPDVMRFESQPI